MGKSTKVGKTSVYTKEKTPLLPLSGVRKSSRESGGICMSMFLARNKAQVSQICEGDKYPTIGVVLTAISMCISSMRPTTVCSVVKDAS